jgi:hypothetical protein
MDRSHLLFVIVRRSPPVASEPEADPESVARHCSFLVVMKQAGLFCPSMPQIAGIGDESDQVPKGRSVDALASRGDEGRGTLR